VVTIVSSFSRCALGDHEVAGSKVILNARFPCLQIPPHRIEQVLVILNWALVWTAALKGLCSCS
jgi:hypothetical protein